MRFEYHDPLEMARELWPHISFYQEQEDIIYSVRDNDETFVPAGNMLGKDFVSAFIALWFFLSRTPSRVVTTSVDGTQLEGVLWGEIRRFIQCCKFPMEQERGGPLIVNHLHLRKVIKGKMDALSYCIGRVAARGEGMLGHHIAKQKASDAFTLFIADEASGVDDVSYERADTWAHRKLIIGNTYPCTNFFYKGVQAGDKRSTDNNHYYRRIIRIRGQDSPNVRIGMAHAAAREPVPELLELEGVLSYADYVKRRQIWDKMRQCIGLDAEFYQGAEVLLYPPEWLNTSALAAERLKYSSASGARRTMGIDPAEGGDRSVWTIIDNSRLIDQISLKTPDTTVVTARTIAYMSEYHVLPADVYFDRGGGGKEHADNLRAQGYPVNTVAFGESAISQDKFVRRMRTRAEREEEAETKYTYKNRRAQMYHLLRLMLDPTSENTFAIPGEYNELRRQLGLIPLMYDREGRLVLPPKNKNTPNSTEQTLVDIIGHSPDEADSLVLAVFGLFYKPKVMIAGVGF